MTPPIAMTGMRNFPTGSTEVAPPMNMGLAVLTGEPVPIGVIPVPIIAQPVQRVMVAVIGVGPHESQTSTVVTKPGGTPVVGDVMGVEQDSVTIYVTGIKPVGQNSERTVS
jgi:hypothetical protein